MKKLILIGLALFAAGFFLGIWLDNLVFTGETIRDVELNNGYTYTKAICNSDKECIDVLIKCWNGEIISLEPVSDLIRYDDNWDDFRPDYEKLCK